MLVLTRKVGETIVVQDNVRITILEMDRGKVRIGVEAPANVRVHRHEVWERLHKNEGDKP